MMKRLVVAFFCVSVVGPRALAYREDSYRSTPFSQPRHCRLLESSLDRIRLEFSWPADQQDPRPEAVYLAVPRSATTTITYDRWHLTLLHDGNQEEVLIGSADTASREEIERINELMEKSTLSPRHPPIPDKFFFHDVPVLRFYVAPEFVYRQGSLAPKGSRVRILSLEVTIAFSGIETEPLPSQPPQEFPGGFPSLYRHLLLNYESVDLYRTRPEGKPAAPDRDWVRVIGLTQARGSEKVLRKNAVKILTRRDTLYAVRGADLRRAGIDPERVDLSSLSLWSQQESRPFAVINPDGDRFGEETAVVFRGIKTDSPYTRDAVFWLVWGDVDLPRHPAAFGSVADPSAAVVVRRVTETLYFEEDHQLARRAARSYEWLWKALGQHTGIDLPVPGRSPESSVTVDIVLFSRERVNQRVELRAGGSSSSDSISPDQEKTIRLVISATDAVSCATIDLGLPMTAPLTKPIDPLMDKTDQIRRVFLSSYSIEYRRHLSMKYGPFDFLTPAAGIPMRFEVRDCTPYVEPVLLAETPDGRFLDWTGTLERDADIARFTVVSKTQDVIFDLFDVRQLPSPEKTIADYATNLHDPENSADVLVLAHPMFIDPVLDPWIEWRESQGYRVQVIDVFDIYDEFNFGQPSCESIRDFLGYTLLTWKPPLPQYVILIGDASHDHRDNQGTGIPDLLPTYVPVETPEALASDVWYTYIFGGPNDTMPEMILGRISVRSVEELKNVVQKILIYEKEPDIGPWRARNIFVNDDTFERDAIRTTRDSMPPAFENTYVNQSDFPHVTNPYLAHLRDMEEKYSPACTDAIINAFNEGGLILQYFGHGGNQLWSHERIFMGTDRKVSDVLLLAENRRFPFVVNWSCLTGLLNFNIPPFHVCLSEELLRQPRRGAIVVWSPSENGTTEQHRILAHHLIKHIGRENRTIVGDAIEAARMDFSLLSTARELYMQYITFGDPLVRLAVPTRTATISVEPAAVQRNKSTTISIIGRTDPGFSGLGSIWVATEEQRELASVTDLAIEKGIFTCAVQVRPPLDAEEVRIRFYGLSSDGRSDVWGGATVPALLPNLVIEDLVTTVQQPNVVEATWTVANSSAIESPAALCRIRAGLSLENLPVPALPAGSTTALAWRGTVSFPTSIEVVVDPSENIAEVNEGDNRATARVLVGETTSVIALIGNAAIQPENPSDGADVQIRIPFAHNTNSATTPVTAWLIGLPTQTQRKDFVLGRNQNTDQVWIWEKTPAGNHDATLVVAVDDLPPATVGIVTFSVSERPDLAFMKGTLEYEPDRPILGQSIYLKTRLYNIGNAPARDVRISAYDGPKEQNKPIKQFQNKTYVQPTPIPLIEPGDGVDLRIRWDMPGFRGTGEHDVTVVADPADLIPELDETNNEDSVQLTIHDLPDLTLDPWDDFQYLLPPNSSVQWGQLVPIQARARNQGNSPAKRVRMSVLFNGEEYSYFFPVIMPGMVHETRVALPSYYGKNTLEIQLDRYDLIAEKGEIGEGVGNNLSKPKYLYLLMMMPPAPKENNRLVYHIENETEFAAGFYEYAGWMPGGGLGIPSDLEEYNVGLIPTYALDSTSFSTVRIPQKWSWEKKYTCFIAPTVEGQDIEFSIPAPNGKYEVFIEVFTKAWHKNLPGSFLIRCENEKEFRRVEPFHSGEGYLFQPLGLYHIQEDRFNFTLRSTSSPDPTAFYKVKFKRPLTDDPVAAGYPSALFPAGDFERKRAIISWDCTIPEGTDLGVRARWWEKDPKGKLRPLPWPRLVPGKQGRLEIVGKGDFVQFYALFARFDHGYASPLIHSVTITVEPEG